MVPYVVCGLRLVVCPALLVPSVSFFSFPTTKKREKTVSQSGETDAGRNEKSTPRDGWASIISSFEIAFFRNEMPVFRRISIQRPFPPRFAPSPISLSLSPSLSLSLSLRLDRDRWVASWTDIRNLRSGWRAPLSLSTPCKSSAFAEVDRAIFCFAILVKRLFKRDRESPDATWNYGLEDDPSLDT